MEAEKHVPCPVPSCKMSEDPAPTQGNLRSRSPRWGPPAKEEAGRGARRPPSSPGGGPHQQRSNHTPPAGQRQALVAQRWRPSDAQVRLPPLVQATTTFCPTAAGDSSLGPSPAWTVTLASLLVSLLPSLPVSSLFTRSPAQRS